MRSEQWRRTIKTYEERAKYYQQQLKDIETDIADFKVQLELSIKKEAG